MPGVRLCHFPAPRLVLGVRGRIVSLPILGSNMAGIVLDWHPSER
jgi:hypothetical protein